jgi:hypothetical protein
MLAYGVIDDVVDEYICMGESTCLETMYKFYRMVVVVLGDH